MSRLDDLADRVGHLDDWDDPMSTYVLLMIIFGCTFTFVPIIVLVGTAPLVAATLMLVLGLGLGLLGGFVWWASNRPDASDGEGETTRERDPLSVLKDRYARGEISEEEFEHRVTMLLDVDEIAGRKQEAELERA